MDGKINGYVVSFKCEFVVVNIIPTNQPTI